MTDEAVGKTLHRRRWRICRSAISGGGTNQRGPSGGSAVLELADDAMRDITHGVDRTDHLLLADHDIVE